MITPMLMNIIKLGFFLIIQCLSLKWLYGIWTLFKMSMSFFIKKVIHFKMTL